MRLFGLLDATVLLLTLGPEPIGAAHLVYNVRGLTEASLSATSSSSAPLRLSSSPSLSNFSTATNKTLSGQGFFTLRSTNTSQATHVYPTEASQIALSLNTTYSSLPSCSPSASTSRSSQGIASSSWASLTSTASEGTLTTPITGTSFTALSSPPALAASQSIAFNSSSALRLQYTQIDASNSTAVFNISITTTITSLPSNISTSLIPRVSSDTTTTINGTVFPVLYTGNDEGILLAGLGLPNTPTLPKRPGCDLKGLLAIFKTWIPCGAGVKIPGIGVIVIDPRGIPRMINSPTVPKPDPPGTDPGVIPDPSPPDPEGQPDDSSDDNDDDNTTSDQDQKTRISAENRESNTLLSTVTRSTAIPMSSHISSSRKQSSSTSASTKSSASSSSASGTLTRWEIFSTATADPNPAALRSLLETELGPNGFQQQQIMYDKSTTDIWFGASMSNAAATRLADRKDVVGAIVPNLVISSNANDYPTDEELDSTSSTSSSFQSDVPSSGSSSKRRDEFQNLENTELHTSLREGAGGQIYENLNKRAPPPPSTYAFISQYWASTELRFISQKEGSDDLSVFNDYVFGEPAGQRVPLYIMHFGANPGNDDYKNMTAIGGTVRWLWPEEEKEWADYSDEPWHEESDSSNQGACTASLATGYLFGVAKKADLIIVPIPWRRSPGQITVDYEGWMMTLLNLQHDIITNQEKDPNYKPVVLIPKQWLKNSIGGANSIRKSLTERAIAGIKCLVIFEASVITGAGDFHSIPEDGITPGINTIPALARQEIQEMIVVGGMCSKSLRRTVKGKTVGWQFGQKMPYSRDDNLIDVWAPGFRLACAKNDGDGVQIASGTEYAAALVAGLAVYFISIYKDLYLSQVTPHYSFPQIVKDTLIARAWPRDGGPPAIANGLSGNNCPPPQVAPWIWDTNRPGAVPRKKKRDDTSGPFANCPANASMVSSTSSAAFSDLSHTSASASAASSSTNVSQRGGTFIAGLGAAGPATSSQLSSNSTTVSPDFSHASVSAASSSTNAPERGGSFIAGLGAAGAGTSSPLSSTLTTASLSLSNNLASASASTSEAPQRVAAIIAGLAAAESTASVASVASAAASASAASSSSAAAAASSAAAASFASASSASASSASASAASASAAASTAPTGKAISIPAVALGLCDEVHVFDSQSDCKDQCFGGKCTTTGTYAGGTGIWTCGDCPEQ